VGDLARLTPPVESGASPDDNGDQPMSVPIEAAAHALVGTCLSSRHLPLPPAESAAAATASNELTGRELAQLFVEFARRRWRRTR
jgi:hypothetical protein